MNPILQGLQEGYGEEEILLFLSKAIPQLGNSIKKATKSGYGTREILGFLSKNFDTESLRGKSESQIHAINRRADAERAKYGLKVAATAVVAPIAGNMARSALSRALPHSLAPESGSLTNLNNISDNSSPQLQQSLQLPKQTIPIEQQSQNLSSQPPVNQVSPNVTQPVNAVQPEVISNPKEYLEKRGVLKQVDEHLKRGTSPEGIMAVLTSEGGKTRGKTDPELLKNIEEYAKQPQSVNSAKDETLINEEPKTMEKGSTVASPHGVGKLLESRNGKSLVEVDGKKHQVNEDELETPEFSDDEVADAYDNIMAKIPEEHRSGFISWAGYDEDRNVLGFIPRGGKYEELQDISPTEAHIIKEGVGTARTSGETREGLWVVGEDTRGGLISQIIWDRKRKKEAGEKKQLTLGFDLPKPEKEDKGMKPIFDEMKYAREKSRERERKINLAERERKKKEKDEIKKRKK